MSWPIPDIPQKNEPLPFNYKLWALGLFFIIIISFALIYYVLHVHDLMQLLFYIAIVPFVTWVPVFSFFLIQHEHIKNNKIYWDVETEKTKNEWCNWAQKGVPVLGNVIYSPRENLPSLFSLSSANEDVEPNKVQSLYFKYENISHVFKKIDEDLENQHKNYRELLHSIYIVSQDLQDSLTQASFCTWQLMPEFCEDLNHLTNLYDSDQSGLILIITPQLWESEANLKVSEFVSAQLLSTMEFVQKESLPFKASILRMMDTNQKQLTQDLEMWREYNRASEIHDVWFPYYNEKAQLDFLLFASQAQWPVFDEGKLISTDQVFGPASSLNFMITLSMALDTSIHFKQQQLIISQPLETQEGLLCLIKPEAKS